MATVLLQALSLCLAVLLATSTWHQRDAAHAQASGERPNFVVVLLDDATLADMRAVPSLHALLSRHGATFTNAFVTTSLCCPSRATFLRGQYVHNHQVIGHGRDDGYGRFARLGHNRSTIVTWLRNVGYRTGMIGKFLNGYAGPGIPLGWDEWNSIGRSRRRHENGFRLEHDPAAVFADDMITDVADDFIRRSAAERKPFFAWIGMNAPHQPRPIAPARYRGAFAQARLPDTPAINEADVSDKPDYLRNTRTIDATRMRRWTALYQDRLESLLGARQNLRRLLATLTETGEAANTYVIVTSDNGFHIGEHRLSPGKKTAYEEDIRVPLYVIGPGVPRRVQVPHMTLNTDFAPTLAELAGVQAADFVDGRSFAALLSGSSGIDPSQWRHQFMVENFDRELTGGRTTPTPPHQAVRTRVELFNRYYDTGDEQYDFSRTYEVSEEEYYVLSDDPFQLSSQHDAMPQTRRTDLEAAWRALRSCSAQSCRDAEGGVAPPAP